MFPSPEIKWDKKVDKFEITEQKKWQDWHHCPGFDIILEFIIIILMRDRINLCDVLMTDVKNTTSP